MNVTDVIKHLRTNYSFESTVSRDKSRKAITHEFFTPDDLVNLGIDLFPQEAWLPEKTFIDSSCGDGQILAGIIVKKLQSESSYQQALATTYGVDLMEDNCRECIKRLYMCEDSDIQALDEAAAAQRFPDYKWSPGLKEIYVVDTRHYQGIARIVCADGLKYDYAFGLLPEPEEFGNGLFTVE